MKIPKATKTASGGWRIQLRIDGKSIPVHADTKTECEILAMQIKSGTKRAPERSTLTLTQAIDRYIDERSNVLSPSTIMGYRTVQRTRFQTLMNRKCNSITVSDVRAAVNQESVSVSAKTLKNAYGLICSVLQDNGVDVRGVRLPQQVKKEHAFLDGEQICRLIDAARGTPIELPVTMQLWLGLRRSEVLALHWEDFDFTKKTVHIQRAKVPNEAHEYEEVDRTKTAGSNRIVSCPDYILQRLLDTIEPQDRRGQIFRGVNPNTYLRRVNALCDKAGVPHVGTHGLRHTNASVMLELGIANRIAMARGGWTTESTLTGIYQHVFSGSASAADQMINAYFSDIVRDKQKTP